MIDIHSHILPNVDDGSNSLDLSRKLLMSAYKEGIKQAIITPHFARPFEFRVHKYELIDLFEDFIKKTKDCKVDLYLGNELFIDKNMDKDLLNDNVLSLNNSKYVLVEFPFDEYLDDYDEYLYNVSLDYKIIIAHPERYDYVLRNPKFVNRWLNEGYYLQANQNSLNNFKQRRIIFKWIEESKLAFIASDAHNASRPLTLKNAYTMVVNKYGKDIANILMEENPKRVIDNQELLNKRVAY
ncbi:MAG: hypothetical protein Q4E33_05395 [Erysipelotrichaceae bacterium]|nr:hypothetical protein [Erysipelotrichaceae bacterium]